MDRNFALLGLSEKATPDQIQKAYERRLKKYQSSDYEDEKEYANRKIRELKAAYAAALSKAGAGDEAPAPAEPRPVEKEGAFAKKAKQGLSQVQATSRREVKDPARGKAITSIVLSLIVAVVGLLGMCDSENDDYADEYETMTPSFAFSTDEDQRIFDTAMDALSELTEQPWESVSGERRYEDKTKELREQADWFAQNYMGKESIAEVADDLWDRYDEFSIDSTDSVWLQVENILAFYGFDGLEMVEGYGNPYDDDEPIETLTDYLIYLNGYYDDYGLHEAA